MAKELLSLMAWYPRLEVQSMCTIVLTGFFFVGGVRAVGMF